MARAYQIGLVPTDFTNAATERLPNPTAFKRDSMGEGYTQYSSLSSPYDVPTTLRYSRKREADVYKSSNISPAYYAADRSGKSVSFSVETKVTETDSTDAAYRVDYPIRATISLRLPNTIARNGVPTGFTDTIRALVQSVVAGCGDFMSDTTRVSAIDVMMTGGTSILE
uniref:Uncharacterized protein n=1 Tax=Ensystermes virus TaxID=2796588 RepID=A0A7T7GUY9_9VIRU|nr:hypothetical protein [Ensystermes virus]